MPFDELPSFDRINLASTFFQATIVLAFAAAHIGATQYLRRPAVRAIAWFWALYGIAAFLNIFSSWSGAVWQSREISRAITSVVAACSAAAIPCAVSAVRSMGTGEDRPPVWRDVRPWFFGVLVLHAAGVFSLGALLPERRVFAIEYSRMMILLVGVVPAVFAWRVQRAATTRSRGLGLFAIGLTVLAVRQFVSFLLGLRVGRPNLPAAYETAAIAVEVIGIMALGAFSLLAISAEELRFEQQQAAALRGAQARLADGERMESLGRLAAGVAHDFNNVLQIIMLTSAALKARFGETMDQHVLGEMDAATAHGRALVRQLLDFARPTQSADASCDAAARLGGIAAMLQTLVTRRITLRIGAPAAPVKALVDPNAFEQVVINLVTNARDAMPRGGTLEVTLAYPTFAVAQTGALDLPPGTYVQLTVVDTGSGIRPDQLPHIFEPFFTTKQSDRGTGLGLSTVYGIARSAGGGVRVTSVVDGGTTFDVFLPAA